ncbi:MAG TPA: hypothetical protein VIM11_25020 [Tepidisphaeraceae bacterium]|jgi:hypothetical protein
MNVAIAFKHDTLGLPYPGHQDGEDVRHVYVDLRQQPELIDKLPELKDSPELRNAVAMINGPDGAFRTLGCEKAVSAIPNSHLQKMVSYIDLAFANWNDNRDVERFFCLRGTSPDSTPSVAICPTHKLNSVFSRQTSMR